MWNPWEADDWNKPDDGETVGEMLENAFMEEEQARHQKLVDKRLWEMARAGYFSRDGDYIGPRRG